MAKELSDAQFADRDELVKFFDEGSKMLIDARETEPLLRNGMKYAKSKLK
jgi:hypothetical protein